MSGDEAGEELKGLSQGLDNFRWVGSGRFGWFNREVTLSDFSCIALCVVWTVDWGQNLFS